MGTVIDAITLAVGSGFSIANLVMTIAQWRRSRPDRPTVTVRRGEVEVTLAGLDRDDLHRPGVVEDLARIVDALEGESAQR